MLNLKHALIVLGALLWAPELQGRVTATDVFQPIGRLVLDQTVSSYPEGQHAIDLSAARLGFKARLDNWLAFKTEANFAGGSANLLTAAFAYKYTNGSLTFGQSKVPLGLEITGSSLHSSFAERALVSNLVGGVDRMLGIKIQQRFRNDWVLEGGVYRDALSDDGSLSKTVMATRATWARELGGAIRHLGFSVRARQGSRSANIQPVNLESLERFASLPNAVFEDSKDILVGLEALYMQKQFLLHAEAYSVQGPSAKAQGAFMDISWFHGGRRGYNHQRHVFDDSEVSNPIFFGGSGALEIILRVEYIQRSEEQQLDENQISGTLGVTWHLSQKSRVLVNGMASTCSYHGSRQCGRQFSARVQIFF